MARQCCRLCAWVFVVLGAMPAALAQSADRGEPDRGAAVAMACVVVGGLVLVVGLLRVIGRRNRPVEDKPAEGKRDLVAEAMAALEKAQGPPGEGKDG